MIKTREEYQEWREAIEKFPNIRMWPDDMRNIVETIEALRAAIRQAPKVTVRKRGTDVCAFCFSHPADDHYAHCAFNALPAWLVEDA